MRLDGISLELGSGQLVRIAPAYEAIAADDPPCCGFGGEPVPSLALRGYAQQWTLGFSSAAERDCWRERLLDAIDLSHGEGSPYHDWSLGATLGSGSFATVRVATHRASGRRCACKVLSRSFVMSQGDAAAAFAREVSVMHHVAGALPKGAGVVRLLEEREYGDELLLFMSPLANGNLLQLLAHRGVLDERQAAAATRALLLALASLHAAGVCHLDIKPQNLLYRQPPAASAPAVFVVDGAPAELLVADWGCARRLEAAPGGGSSWAPLRNDGGGTLYFTPPCTLEEELQGAPSDIWAAGCVFFALLRLRLPFVSQAGDTDEMVRLRILRAEPLFEGAADEPPLSDGAMAFIRRLLCRDWRTRCTAAEALDDSWLRRVTQHHQQRTHNDDDQAQQTFV